MTGGMPARIETGRLVVRVWQPEDALPLKDAIDTSLDHLRRWLPWAASEPSSPEALHDRLRRFAAAFDEGREWLYGVWTRDETQVLGGAGMHPRIGPGGLEIGYWLRAAAEGHGYATEAIGALTAAAFAAGGIDRLEIRCDPQNVRSAAVPRRLGYDHVETIGAPTQTAGGEPRPTMVWRLMRSAWTAPVL